MRPTPLVLAAAAVLTVAVAASAHDTWLIPATATAAVGKPTELRLTSGMAFAADDFFIEAARVARASVRSGGAVTVLTKNIAHPKALHFPWTPSAAGIATFGVSLHAKDLTLEPELVEVYYADINASKAVRDRYAAMPKPRQWRERYTKHATSYVCVAGGAANDSSWTKPLALNLEIIPEVNPTRLRAGDALPVRVLYEGKPIAGFQVGAIIDGNLAVKFVPTNAAGRATVQLPKAGWWLINGTHIRPATVKTREWDSDFATMTVLVGAAGSKPGC